MASLPSEDAANHACFFYGTLMSVQILCRVIGRNADHLEFADALLEGYTRHHVKGVDYPAIVPAADGTDIIGRTLSKEEASVRGTIVNGLSAADIRFLDTFEGDEYERISVAPLLLSPWRKASDSRQRESFSSNERTSALVYVWIAPRARLEPDLWSFEDFLRDKAHRWVGNGVDEAEYLEVDRRRRMEGKIVHAPSPEVETAAPLPEFGHTMRDACFSFKLGYTNLNHGGLGALPREIAAVRRKHQDRAEEAPDKHFRKDYIAELTHIKKRCGQYLHCDGDDLAFVLNATTGCNIVLRSLRWQKGDRILFFPNAVYGSLHHTLLYVQDHYEDVQLVPVDFTFPCSHASILSRTRSAIEETLASLQPGETIRLGLLDAICSKPGAVMPWSELCALYREYGILSLVDAAHLMGQMPVNLAKADPDFWVSNAHKWCFAPRSLAVFYVPKRNHHLIETFPTSFGYVSSRTPKTVNTPSSFSADFSYTGTQDVAGVLSLPSAFDFREVCGGESRIMNYNHSLVIEGAKYLSDKLGTEVMHDDTCELIASMANVRLPLDHIQSEEQSKVALKLDFILLDDYNIAAAAYAYDARVWIRVAAQIYNEIGDFHRLGAALEEILRDGKLANV